MNQFCLDPVAITGAGVLACNGIGRGAFWNALVTAPGFGGTHSAALLRCYGEDKRNSKGN